MSHGCFISYKKEDKNKGYLAMIVNRLRQLEIPCSYLDRTIDSENIDTVISVLRTQYMNNKPVTLFLIGQNSYEDTRQRWARLYGPYYRHDEYNKQSFIIRELRATLSDYDGNPRHGVVGIVMPDMYNKVFAGTSRCPHCGQAFNLILVNDDTVIREFWENYYLIPERKGCDHYSEKGRYCILCTMDDFLEDPNSFIDAAYDKSQSALADFVHYKDIEHDYKLRDE